MQVEIEAAGAPAGAAPTPRVIPATSPPKRAADPTILGLPRSRWAEYFVPGAVGIGLVVGALLYWLVMTRTGLPGGRWRARSGASAVAARGSESADGG